MTSTYWNSRKPVPSVIAPLATSAALTMRATTEPIVTAPCTAHHMRMNACWRRTELRSMPPLSSTKRHMAWAPAPFGAEVLGRRQALLDAAVERARAPISSAASLIARWRIASSTHDGDREVHEHAEADAPVEDGEHAEHPGDEQDAAGGLRDDLRQEVGHRRDVAVDALDQLARRVRAVELVVEAEDVAGHAQAQLVGRAPRGDRRVADDDDADRLRRHGDGEEHAGPGATNVDVLAPSVASSTIVRTTSGPASASAELAPRSAPRTAQRRASGRSRASRARPRDGDALGTGPVSRRNIHSDEAVSRHRRATAPVVTRRGGRSSLRSMENDIATLEPEADRPRSRRRARRGGAAGRGDLDRRDVRRLLTSPVTRCSTAGWSSIRRSRCDRSRSARSPTTTATAG